MGTLLFCHWALAALPTNAQTSAAALPNINLSMGGSVTAMVMANDGKLFVGGLFTMINGVPRRNLARLNPDGTVDTSWAPDPDGVVYALVLGDDALFVGGAFAKIGGLERFALAKLPFDKGGSADSDWEPNPGGSPVVALATDGFYLYVSGNFYSMGGRSRSLLARVEMRDAGLVDSQWNPSPNAIVKSIWIDGSDVYLGGEFTIVGEFGRNFVARVDNASGVADPNWDPNPIGPVNAVVTDDLSVYIGGNFTVIAGESHLNLAKVGKDTVVDSAWRPDTDDLVSGLTLDEGHLYVTGAFEHIGGQSRHGIAKLNLTSLPLVDANWDAKIDDLSFAPVAAMVADTSGLYVGGQFLFANSEVSSGIAKLNPETGVRLSEFSAQIQQPGEVKALVQQADGKIVIGGSFAFASNLPRFNLARIQANGLLDTNWSPAANGTVFALASSGTNLFVGGAFTQIGGLFRTNLAKLSGTNQDAVDPGWNPNPEGGYVIYSLSIDETNIYVAGTFSRIGGQNRRNLAKLGTSDSGEADPNWAPDTNSNASGEVNRILADNESVYVAGSFGFIGGEDRNTLARLDANGSGLADPAWFPDLPNPVINFAVDGTNVYALAGREIIRISALGSGAIDSSWQAPADELVRSIAVYGSNLYAGGDFTWIGGQTRKFLARFQTSAGGAADPTWNRPITDDYGPVLSLLPVPNGVFAGGSFTMVNGVPRGGVAFFPELQPPTISANSGTLIITANPLDASSATGFRITDIAGVSLYRSDGVTPVDIGDFITVEEARAGLRYAGIGIISAVAALDVTPGGMGNTTATFTVSPDPVNPPLLFSDARSLGDGGVVMQLRGATNAAYSIFASTVLDPDLSHWIEIFRLTNYAGVTVFTNYPSSLEDRWFYRAAGFSTP